MDGHDADDAKKSTADMTAFDYYHKRLPFSVISVNFCAKFASADGDGARKWNETVFIQSLGVKPRSTRSTSSCSFSTGVNEMIHKLCFNVYHYGVIEGGSGKDFEMEVIKGREVLLFVDELRRKLNSRLHSAGHLLDACMQDVGLGHLEPGKGYHFPDGPFVEYKGTIPQNELQSKQNELVLAANALISRGGKVSAAVLPYEEAAELCGGFLPDYIPKDSTPRVVKLGNSAVCCGGTHVSDISEIISLQVSQIRKRKGVTKVSYTVGS
ncbi:hypothetical protein SADUNF_Sadunf10G0014700 [Salix dunnii]|uniref:Alanyl-transfer RNA synthetases family profile domain-containing protein n=1 Tax=Salix dunnii TaxID=1413687 RepID=A0A835JRT6_9ROSI|nr:hypothetical protein SADUNF_Sadunf10G0014700 [Salix dunnii]